MTDLCLKVTRGDATMLYATSHGSYTVRFHLRLDQKIDGQKLRSAMDKTARRYPYLCVCLRRNEREFYYYDALLDELKENGIEYVECGTTPVRVADIRACE